MEQGPAPGSGHGLCLPALQGGDQPGNQLVLPLGGALLLGLGGGGVVDAASLAPPGSGGAGRPLPGPLEVVEHRGGRSELQTLGSHPLV
jgi:hypothetical protein